MAALFACANCHGRLPYEDLNEIDHLCKGCQKLKTTCSHCRDEFHLESKYSKETICKRCAHYVEKYGLPSSCKYCNLLAAFVGTKCERCSNQEKKFGPPKTCEQCQQKSAFIRPNKMVLLENKVLCWLCARSYKKLLSSSIHKTKSKRIPTTQGASLSPDKKRHKSLYVSDGKELHKKSAKHPHKQHYLRGDKNGPLSSSDINANADNSIIPKKATPRNYLTSLSPPDLGNSDQFLVINQLTEEVASLKKQMGERDKMLLEKDKKIGEIKAQHFEAEKDIRNKIQSIQKEHRENFESLQNKNRDLLKQISQLAREKRGKMTNAPEELNITPSNFLSVESPRSNSPFVL